MINGLEFCFDEIQRKGDRIVITLEGESFEFVQSGQYLSPLEGPRVKVQLVEDPLTGRTHLHIGSHTLWLKEKTWEAQTGLATRPGYESPMPGKILKILVQKGDLVQEGDSLLILEAMKMEHTISAQADGVIKEIHYTQGEQVAAHALLLEME